MFDPDDHPLNSALVNLICQFCIDKSTGGEAKSPVSSKKEANPDDNAMVDFERVKLLDEALAYVPSVIEKHRN